MEVEKKGHECDSPVEHMKKSVELKWQESVFTVQYSKKCDLSLMIILTVQRMRNARVIMHSTKK